MSGEEALMLVALLALAAFGGWLVLRVAYVPELSMVEQAQAFAERQARLHRASCWCGTYRKPCTECAMFEDGLDAMVEWVEFQAGVVR